MNFGIVNDLCPPQIRQQGSAFPSEMSAAPTYHADLYNKYRPTYPKELLDIVLKFHTGEYNLALDVATGTGQTASMLTKHFKKTVGTDASISMLDSAINKDKIEYKQAPAEDFHSIIQDVDLITVSTAAHWFNMEVFYAECMRTLKPDGTLAIWAYGHMQFKDYPEMSKMMVEYSTVFMAPYWDKRRVYLDNMYSDPEYTQSPFKVSIINQTFSRNVYPDAETGNSTIMTSRWSFTGIKQYSLHN